MGSTTMRLICGVTLLLHFSLGCSDSPKVEAVQPKVAKENESVVYGPEVFDIPMFAAPTTLGGAWRPDVLSGTEMAALLDRPLPEPASVPESQTLWETIAKATGKEIVWERVADSPAIGPPTRAETTPHRESFPDSPRPTVRDGLSRLLMIANREATNIPRDGGRQLRNFILITRGQIIILSLPVE
jgi:hypothetical protein